MNRLAMILVAFAAGLMVFFAGGGQATADGPGLRAESVSVGSDHACAILPSRTAVCWGNNSYGQLGNGSTERSNRPVRVRGLGRVRSIEAGYEVTCAIRMNGRVMCWGNNYDGILGPKRDRSSRPVRINRIRAREVSLSPIGVCALGFGGQVYCWGDKSGFGNKSGVRPRPVPVPGVSDATSVATGTYSSCAVRRNHRVVCWSNAEFRLRPKRNLGPVLDLEISLESGCALRTTNRMICWGDNLEGMLGVGKETDRSVKPLRVPGLGKVRDASTDGSTSCAVRLTGRVLCWGYNEGTVGDGTRRERFRPALVPRVTGALAVSVEDSSACATTRDLDVYCWGYNGRGKIGDGTYRWRLRPVRVVAVRSR